MELKNYWRGRVSPKWIRYQVCHGHGHALPTYLPYCWQSTKCTQTLYAEAKAWGFGFLRTKQILLPKRMEGFSGYEVITLRYPRLLNSKLRMFNFRTLLGCGKQYTSDIMIAGMKTSPWPLADMAGKKDQPTNSIPCPWKLGTCLRRR